MKLNAAAPALLTIFLLIVFCFGIPTLAVSTAPTASIEPAVEPTVEPAVKPAVKPVEQAASPSAGPPADSVHERSHQSTRSDPYSILSAARQRHRSGLYPEAKIQLPTSIAELRSQLDATLTDQPERLKSSLEQRAIALKSSTQRQAGAILSPVQNHIEQSKTNFKASLRRFIQRIETALHSAAETLR